ncbi:hypothetical protein DSUL_50142 [Desulfovibrionales bacterium]
MPAFNADFLDPDLNLYFFKEELKVVEIINYIKPLSIFGLALQ